MRVLLLWTLVVAAAAVSLAVADDNDQEEHHDDDEDDDDDLYMGPRDRFWRHHAVDQTLVLNGIDHYDTLKQCLHESLSQDEWRALLQQQTTDDQPHNHNRTVVRTVPAVGDEEEEEEVVALVQIAHALPPLHAKGVQALAACVRRILPEYNEARAYYVEQGYDKDPGGGMGGNNPTHLAPLVGLFFPAVVHDMYQTLQLAYDAAQWWRHDDVLPPPHTVGFRASEHLTYDDFRDGLMLHTDGPETLYTLNYALGAPDDYDGGDFVLALFSQDHDEDWISLKPNQYDALVLLGGRYEHGVRPIRAGRREMWSSEFWRYPDLPFGATLWAGVDWRMRKFLHLCNLQQQQANDDDAPCTIDIDSLEEDDEFYNEMEHENDDEDGEDDEDGQNYYEDGDEEDGEEEEDEDWEDGLDDEL